MKEYSVRYLSMKTLTSVCENGKTVKYTYEEAVEKAKELNARADVSYCKIYKGRTLIETVEKAVEETAETETEETIKTTAERQKEREIEMKYTMQELKDIYFEAKDRFGYIEDEDIMGYGNIAKKAERVLTGKTKFCRFNICEKDTISAMFTEDDDACIVNDTYDEYVKRYGDHAELVMKMYGVKKVKAQTAETAVTVEQTEVEETAEIETEKPETAETDDSGFEYYSVETAYEVDFRDRQNEVFKTYSEAEKTAGDNIILEVDLIVRNDKKAVSEHDKEVFEDETDEIECRCIWYHHNGVKGMIAQDTKRVIKKPETAEVSKEVVDNRKEVNSTSFIQQLYDAEYSKTLTVQGGIERFLKLAKEFVKNKSTEMSLIVDTAAQVLHDKYKLDYGTIETLEIEAYNS